MKFLIHLLLLSTVSAYSFVDFAQVKNFAIKGTIISSRKGAAAATSCRTACLENAKCMGFYNFVSVSGKPTKTVGCSTFSTVASTFKWPGISSYSKIAGGIL